MPSLEDLAALSDGSPVGDDALPTVQLPPLPAYKPPTATPVNRLRPAKATGSAGNGDGLATTSLVTGIVGMCVPLANLAAIITGVVGLTQMKSAPGGKRGFAIAGIVLGVLGLSLHIVGYVMLKSTIEVVGAAAEHSRNTAGDMKCAANLMAVGRGLVTYNNAHQGQFPPTLQELTSSGVTMENLRCPVHGQGSKPGPYVYLADGKNINKLPWSYIVAHDLPDAHPSGKMNLLYADGHVDTLIRDQGLAALAEQNSAASASKSPPGIAR